MKLKSSLLLCRSLILRCPWKHVPEWPFHPLPLGCGLYRHPPRPGRLLREQRLRVQLGQRRHHQRHWQDRLLHLPNQQLPRGPLASVSLSRELLPTSRQMAHLPAGIASLRKLLCLLPVHHVTFLTSSKNVPAPTCVWFLFPLRCRCPVQPLPLSSLMCGVGVRARQKPH